MRRLLTTTALLLFVNIVTAQCDSLVLRYTSTFLNDVSLIDSSTIIGVGDNGYTVKSTDGGKKWRNIQTFQPYLLTAVQMVTDSIGYTVGWNKTVMKTEDGGESWFSIYAKTKTVFQNDYDNYNDVYFLNKSKGFIVADGGALITTTDEGKTWNSTILSKLFYSADNLNSITFINDSIGFICGNSNVIFKTVNGGTTWTSMSIPGFNYDQKFRKIKFINSTVGFAIGDQGLVVKTKDAGVSWTNESNMSLINNYYKDICFTDSLHGIMVGTGGSSVIVQTSDGGNTWKANTQVNSAYSSFYSIDTDRKKQKVVIVGGGGGPTEPLGYNGRRILSTIDGGATFNTLSSNGRQKFAAAFFLTDSTGYIGGENGLIHKTIDFGETWVPLTTVPALLNQNMIRQIFFLDSLVGFASRDRIYKTIDGGNSWTMLSIPGGNVQFFARQIFFYNSMEGLVQDNGYIYRTTDGGITWTRVLTSRLFLYSFTVRKDGVCFAVGYGGNLARSDDHGSTWSNINLSTSDNLTSAYFYDNNFGIVGTSDNAIWRTTDGGLNWTRIATPSTYLEMYSFLFINHNEGYMSTGTSSSSFHIFKTNDGGLTWFLFRQSFEEMSSLSGFNQIYQAGGRGLIWKTENLVKPDRPGYINGPGQSCLNEKSNYFVGEMSGTNLKWSLNDGGINSYKSNSDTVLWTKQGTFTLSVTASNSCGTSESRVITTDVTEFTPVITRMDSLLSVTEGETYQWYRNSIPMASSLGGNSRTIKTTVPATYSVVVKNIAGCTSTTPFYNFVVTLPLQLINFKASLRTTNLVDLNWSTLTDVDTKLFVVERQTLDRRYVAFDSVMAVGTVIGQQNYHLTDANPLMGTNYYRLLIKSKDGKVTYSNIVSVIVSNGANLMIYPNPVANTIIKIIRGDQKIINIIVYDLSDRAILKIKNTSNDNAFSINVGSLKSGTYLIKVQLENSMVIKKVIVAH